MNNTKGLQITETIYLLTGEEIEKPVQVYEQFFRRYGKPPGPGVSYSVDDFNQVMGAAIAKGKHISVSESYMQALCANLELLLAAAALIYNRLGFDALLPECNSIRDAISRLTPIQEKYPFLALDVFFKHLTIDGVRSALCELEISSTEYLSPPRERGMRTRLRLFVGHLNLLVEASYIFQRGPYRVDQFSTSTPDIHQAANLQP